MGLQGDLPIRMTHKQVRLHTNASDEKFHGLTACGTEGEGIDEDEVALAVSTYVAGNAELAAGVAQDLAVFIAGALKIILLFFVAELMEPLQLIRHLLTRLKSMSWQAETFCDCQGDVEGSQIIWMACISEEEVRICQRIPSQCIKNTNDLLRWN